MIKRFNGKKPFIAPDAFVAENATLIGDVTISSGASVWYGAVLRGDINSITIGARSSVQDNVVIHVEEDKPVIVGEDVTIGHTAVLHGCTVEDRCLIGISSVVLDGSVIGEGSIIAASALVPPGKKIKKRVLMAGVPVSKLKNLTDEDYEMLKHHALAYVEYGKQHKKI